MWQRRPGSHHIWRLCRRNSSISSCHSRRARQSSRHRNISRRHPAHSHPSLRAAQGNRGANLCASSAGDQIRKQHRKAGAGEHNQKNDRPRCACRAFFHFFLRSYPRHRFEKFPRISLNDGAIPIIIEGREFCNSLDTVNCKKNSLFHVKQSAAVLLHRRIQPSRRRDYGPIQKNGSPQKSARQAVGRWVFAFLALVVCAAVLAMHISASVVHAAIRAGVFARTCPPRLRVRSCYRFRHPSDGCQSRRSARKN